MSLLNGGESRPDYEDRGYERNEGFLVASSRGSYPVEGGGTAGRRRSLIADCANPGCNSSWLRLWRGRQIPIFEGGWTCSFACTSACAYAAVARELGREGESSERYLHRVPLGLLMMERGWISREQLHRALAAQKAAGVGRVGYWLMQQGATSEEKVTRALGLQWSCPVVEVRAQESVALVGWMPRLFLDAFRALPLRVASSGVIYLGFVERIDPVLALAAERMTGMRVECCMVRESQFLSVHARLLEGQFPRTDLGEATSPQTAARALAQAIERFRPAASRLVRVHDCLWLRMSSGRQSNRLLESDSLHDVLCSIGPVGGDAAASADSVSRNSRT